MRPEAARLHLGCGATHLEGWVNCDLYTGRTVDCVFNLLRPWPFQADSIRAIYASHVLEHLSEPLVFFAEAWRVLQAGGPSSLVLRLPYGNHRAAWWDLTHVRPWFAENFACLQPGYDAAIGNPQHGGLQATPWRVDMAQQRLSKAFGAWMRRRLLRWALMPLVPWFSDAVEELFVYLSPLKDPAARAAFAETRHPAVVPAQYIVYQHHLEQRDLAPGALPEVRIMGLGEQLAGWQ